MNKPSFKKTISAIITAALALSSAGPIVGQAGAVDVVGRRVAIAPLSAGQAGAALGAPGVMSLPLGQTLMTPQASLLETLPTPSVEAPLTGAETAAQVAESYAANPAFKVIGNEEPHNAAARAAALDFTYEKRIALAQSEGVAAPEPAPRGPIRVTKTVEVRTVGVEQSLPPYFWQSKELKAGAIAASARGIAEFITSFKTSERSILSAQLTYLSTIETVGGIDVYSFKVKSGLYGDKEYTIEVDGRTLKAEVVKTYLSRVGDKPDSIGSASANKPSWQARLFKPLSIAASRLIGAAAAIAGAGYAFAQEPVSIDARQAAGMWILSVIAAGFMGAIVVGLALLAISQNKTGNKSEDLSKKGDDETDGGSSSVASEDPVYGKLMARVDKLFKLEENLGKAILPLALATLIGLALHSAFGIVAGGALLVVIIAQPIVLKLAGKTLDQIAKHLKDKWEAERLSKEGDDGGDTGSSSVSLSLWDRLAAKYQEWQQRRREAAENEQKLEEERERQFWADQLKQALTQMPGINGREGLTGGTAFAVLKNLYEQGEQPSLEDLKGWHAGRGVELYSPNRVQAAMLAGQTVTVMGKEGFTVTPSMSDELALDYYDAMSPALTRRVGEALAEMAVEYAGWGSSPEVSEKGRSVSVLLSKKSALWGTLAVRFETRTLGDMLVMKNTKVDSDGEKVVGYSYYFKTISDK